MEVACESAVETLTDGRERRREHRQVTVMRVGLIHGPDGKQFCLIRNLSSDGLMARVYRRFQPGEALGVELKGGHFLGGEVVWSRGYEIGVQLRARIDLADALSAGWAAEDGKRPRLPRLNLNCPATVREGAQLSPVRVRDISPRGARVELRSSLASGTQIVLTLPDLAPIHGVVRWARDGEAGLLFNESLPLEMLARWIDERRNLPSDRTYFPKQPRSFPEGRMRAVSTV